MARGTIISQVYRAITDGLAALCGIDKPGENCMDDGYSKVPSMQGQRARIAQYKALIDATRTTDIRYILVQEDHRTNRVDISGELDGVADIPCLTGETTA